MVDDQDPSESGPGPYPEPFPANHQIHPQHRPTHHQQLGHHQQSSPMTGNPQGPLGYNSMTQLLDPYDPMLDMDPFGLSASMQVRPIPKRSSNLPYLPCSSEFQFDVSFVEVIHLALPFTYVLFRPVTDYGIACSFQHNSHLIRARCDDEGNNQGYVIYLES
jgi:hypothetical protein